MSTLFATQADAEQHLTKCRWQRKAGHWERSVNGIHYRVYVTQCFSGQWLITAA